MEPSPSVKLFGMWASHFAHRVQIALKLKGVQYEYVEEDLYNKSPSLLQYNPVYKKVPVLLHDGRPICESFVILQYIDETWKQNPLLPEDPYERDVVRFWCHFAADKLGASAGAVAHTSGEEQKQAIEQFLANLNLIEGELRDGHFKGRRFFGGEKIGLLDIVIGCGSLWFLLLEEFTGVKLVGPSDFPRLYSYIHDFHELDVVKEIVPDKERLLAHAKDVFRRRAEMNPNKDD